MTDLEKLDAVIHTANYSPQLSEQIMLVAVLDKVDKVIRGMKKAHPCHEHTLASGHIRTALNHERDLMFEMMKRNNMIGHGLSDLHG